MKKILTYVLLAFATIAGAQNQTFNIDHGVQIKNLSNAKDSLYSGILQQYDRHLERNPTDMRGGLEKCKFIFNAFSDEEYNPYYDQAEACADSLLILFPGAPEAMLFATEFIYGDSLKNYLDHLHEISKKSTRWDKFRSTLYEKLANYHNSVENREMTIYFGELAMQENDSLDLSLILARAYKAESSRIKAIDILLKNLDSTDVAWQLNQKGSLLLELNVPDKAMEAFNLAKTKNADSEDSGALAKAMMENGLVAEAREFLFRDYKNSGEWGETRTLAALLNYDIRYGVADSARSTYRKLTDNDFFNDAFGIYRIRLLFKAPLMGWTFGDVGRILFLILVVILAFVVPYLWILPIHYIGEWRRQRGAPLAEGTFAWTLKHFWIACSLWLICSLLSTLVFDYPGMLSNFSDDLGSEASEAISKSLANVNILFFATSVVSMLALVSSEDIRGFLNTIKNHRTDIGVGVGIAFLLRFGLGIYVTILKALGVDFSEGASVICSVTDAIISINRFYNPGLGFLFVVLLVPFYEEILFRGIFLSSCERHLKFIFANILQALVFGAVHQDLKFFVFYVAFGIVAGYYTRKTGSLVCSTSMHMTNNVMAFFAIVARS